MGSSLQRLEILLIGLIVLLAGAVAAVLTLVHPAWPAADGHTSQPTIGSTLLPSGVALTPPPIALPTSAATPIALPQPTTRAVFSSALKTAWPWLLVGAGLVGIGLVMLRLGRRRMTYSGQSVGQLLGAADTTTRTSNIRVMRELAAQGLLTAELAAAADIPFSHGSRRGLRLPAIQLPRLRWPRLTLPALRISRLPVPGWASPRRRLLEIWRAIVRACRSSASAPAVRPGAAPLPPEPLPLQVALSARADSQETELAHSNMPAGDTAQEVWSADDRVQAVADTDCDLAAGRPVQLRPGSGY